MVSLKLKIISGQSINSNSRSDLLKGSTAYVMKKNTVSNKILFFYFKQNNIVAVCACSVWRRAWVGAASARYTGCPPAVLRRRSPSAARCRRRHTEGALTLSYSTKLTDLGPRAPRFFHWFTQNIDNNIQSLLDVNLITLKKAENLKIHNIHLS